MAKTTCEVPVIDLSATDDEVAKALDHAFTEMGFAVLVGHSIPISVIAAAREAVVKYFEQPLDRKLPDRITRDNYRGYIPLGFCLLYTSPSPRDGLLSRMPSSA